MNFNDLFVYFTFVGIWPCGVPLMYLLVLLPSRRHLLDGRSTRLTRAPAFLREALRRDRDALSPSLRRRLTWQQALCLAPLVDLPRLKQ